MYTSETQTMRMRWELGLLNTEHILSTPAVKQFIEDTSKKFDLVVVDQSYNEAMYLFAHKFRCPLVTIGNILINMLRKIFIYAYFANSINLQLT